MSAQEPNAPPPSEWKLPRLRVDVDGAWYDDDVEITHAGILANLRSTLKRDVQGYFIQTRVRIPVAGIEQDDDPSESVEALVEGMFDVTSEVTIDVED